MTGAVRRALWAAAGVLASVGGGCQAGKGGASSDRLVVARPTDAVSLDPARTSDIESLEVAEQVYGRLVRFSAGRLEPEADLATSWTVSSDGTIWTFELRPNVRFHDGTPFDADAVVFSFERQIVPEHPAHEADFVWTRAYHNIRHVRAATPLRVQFEIDRPYAPFLANLAMGPAAIVSPTAVRKWKRDFGRHPVGTGPYRFVEWIPGDRITLERNLDYWDERARTRYLVLIAMADSRQRLQALESGAADVIQQLAPDDLPLVRLNPDLALAMAPATLVSYMAMNTQRRPLNDLRIRRAIAHAVNRDAMVKLVYQGLGIPAIGPLPPNVWGARSDVVTYPYDPPRARKLLARGGLAGRSRGAAEAVRAVGGEPIHAGAGARGGHHQALSRRGGHLGRRHHQRARRSPAGAVGRRTRSGVARLVQRQRRPGQLPLHAARLRQHHRDAPVEHRVLQQRLVPRRHRHGPAHDRSEGSDRAHRTRAAVLAGAGDPGDRRAVGAAGALQGRVRAARDAARAGGAAVGDGSLPLGGARAMSPEGKGGPDGQSGPEGRGGSEGRGGKRGSGRGSSSSLRRLRSSSGNLRQSSIFRAAEWLGRGASVWSLPVSAVMRRHGLRRRLTAVLIIAALGPVIAVSVVAVALIFSSVEQGIKFEAERGLQVARGLFLQQVQHLAAGAAELGDDVALLRAQATAPHAARQRLGELSLKMPSALFETTDADGPGHRPLHPRQL